ncbi:MAG TPA: hypothetical protein ENN41_05135, partial [Sediminispirochaeta sp.]|nr:hypothetical protein [Sediminispirochaeta sp.]
MKFHSFVGLLGLVLLTVLLLSCLSRPPSESVSTERDGGTSPAAAAKEEDIGKIPQRNDEILLDPIEAPRSEPLPLISDLPLTDSSTEEPLALLHVPPLPDTLSPATRAGEEVSEAEVRESADKARPEDSDAAVDRERSPSSRRREEKGQETEPEGPAAATAASKPAEPAESAEPAEASEPEAARSSISAPDAKAAPETIEVDQRIDPEMTVRAQRGEEIRVSMPGQGWFYDEQASRLSGIHFEEVEYLSQGKDFIFSASETGESVLSFSRQDIYSGRGEIKKVLVRVVSERVIEENSAGAGTAEGRSDTGGREAEAFDPEELNRGLAADDPRAVMLQLRKLVESINGTKRLPLENASSGVVDWNTVLDAAQSLLESGYENVALEAIELGEDRTEELDPPLRARVYYLLGRIYETPPPPRDERKAVQYYRRVLG